MKYLFLLLFSLFTISSYAQPSTDSLLRKKADSLWNIFADHAKAKTLHLVETDTLIKALRHSESLYLKLNEMYGCKECKGYALECLSNVFLLFQKEGREDEFLSLKPTIESNYGTFEDYPQIWQMLGSSYLAVGDIGLAEPCFLKAIAAYKKKETLTYQKAECYNELGIIARKKGDFDYAITLYKEAIRIYEQTRYQDGIVKENLAKAFQNLAVVYSILGRYDAAISLLTHQLAQSEISGKDRLIAEINLGEVMTRNGQHLESISLLSSIIKTHPHKSQIGMAYIWLGVAYHAAKNWPAAIHAFQGALAHFEEYEAPKSFVFARAYLPLGDMYVEMGEYESALKAYQKGLTYVSEAFEEEKDFEVYPSVRRMRQEPESVQLLIQKAKALALQAKQSGGPIPDSAILQGYLKADSLLVRIRQNQRSEASRLFTSEQSHQLYSRALEFLFGTYQQGDQEVMKEVIEKAWYLMERHRANLFWEQMQQQDAEGILPASDSLVKNRQLQKSDLIMHEFKLAQAEKNTSPNDSLVEHLESIVFKRKEALEKIEQALAQKYPQYAQLKLREIAPSISVVQQTLLQDAQGIVAYFQDDTVAYVITITRQKAQLHKLSIEPEVIAMAFSILAGSSEAKDHIAVREMVIPHLYTLYQMLFYPLGDLPPRVIILPDGILNYVPFDALLFGQPADGTAWKKMPFCVKTHSISYAPSASILEQLIHRRFSTPTSRPLLSFSPETFPLSTDGQHSLVPSPSLSNILSSIGKDGIYAQESACKSRFVHIAQRTEASYKIVHLFTHASADPEETALSWIQFFGGDDSSKLYLNELYNYRLASELAVLGACETGMGKLQVGEGLMSFARGFFHAGSKSVLATAWQVPPEPTDDILTRFYGYVKKGFPKDIALQRAKLDCFSKQDNWQFSPTNWAGLRLTGTTVPIYEKATPIWCWMLGVALLALVIGLVWRYIKG